MSYILHLNRSSGLDASWGVSLCRSAESSAPEFLPNLLPQMLCWSWSMFMLFFDYGDSNKAQRPKKMLAFWDGNKAQCCGDILWEVAVLEIWQLCGWMKRHQAMWVKRGQSTYVQNHEPTKVAVQSSMLNKMLLTWCWTECFGHKMLDRFLYIQCINSIECHAIQCFWIWHHMTWLGIISSLGHSTMTLQI